MNLRSRLNGTTIVVLLFLALGLALALLMPRVIRQQAEEAHKQQSIPLVQDLLKQVRAEAGHLLPSLEALQRLERRVLEVSRENREASLPTELATDLKTELGKSDSIIVSVCAVCNTASDKAKELYDRRLFDSEVAVTTNIVVEHRDFSNKLKRVLVNSQTVTEEARLAPLLEKERKEAKEVLELLTALPLAQPPQKGLVERQEAQSASAVAFLTEAEESCQRMEAAAEQEYLDGGRNKTKLFSEEQRNEFQIRRANIRDGAAKLAAQNKEINELVERQKEILPKP